jgi:hypothetical protein
MTTADDTNFRKVWKTALRAPRTSVLLEIDNAYASFGGLSQCRSMLVRRNVPFWQVVYMFKHKRLPYKSVEVFRAWRINKYPFGANGNDQLRGYTPEDIVESTLLRHLDQFAQRRKHSDQSSFADVYPDFLKRVQELNLIMELPVYFRDVIELLEHEFFPEIPKGTLERWLRTQPDGLDLSKDKKKKEQQPPEDDPLTVLYTRVCGPFKPYTV